MLDIANAIFFLNFVKRNGTKPFFIIHVFNKNEMPRIFIHNLLVLTYDTVPIEKYWRPLSSHLIKKYGSARIVDHQEVEEVLTEGFNYLINSFRKLIWEEKNLTFFLYVFMLHEDSFKLYLKMLEGSELHTIDEYEFATYRRVLKLILEQGCDINLDWGKLPNEKEVERIDAKMNELLYLGNWMYSFAEFIARQKMIEECHCIDFDEENMLILDWLHFYDEVYLTLMRNIREDYVHATFDQFAMLQLKLAIKDCFKVDYDIAFGQIFEAKRQLSKGNPIFQTIQPYILPLNLVNYYKISQEEAEVFYAALTISKHNKLPIDEVIYKSYSMQRHLYRPILVYNVGGEERALVGDQKFAEAMMVLATNAIHWNALPKEWLLNRSMQEFVNKKGKEHDSILEDEIEDILKRKKVLFARNVKSLRRANKNNLRIDNSETGEIDFLIINQALKIVYVAEAKYNRARYEATGFRNDYSNFINEYEPKLKRKEIWITDNLQIVQEHFTEIYNLTDLDIKDYNVKGIFLINTPTFYMFNGDFMTITLRQFPEFIDGDFEYPTWEIVNETEEKIEVLFFEHPYFRKKDIEEFT